MKVRAREDLFDVTLMIGTTFPSLLFRHLEREWTWKCFNNSLTADKYGLYEIKIATYCLSFRLGFTIAMKKESFPYGIPLRRR